MQAVLDHCGLGHIYASLWDGLLVGVANARFTKWQEVQVSEQANITSHFVVEAIHREEVLNLNWQQEAIRFP